MALNDMDIAEGIQTGLFTWYFFESFGHDLDAVKFLRFENLREDLYRVLKSVADLPAGLVEALRTDPPINVGKRTRYQDYYDEKLRDLIASRDQQLIERFSYTF